MVHWIAFSLVVLSPSPVVQQTDSSIADTVAAIRLAKTIVDNAVWDTTGECPRDRDTVCLTRRDAFISKIAPARAYLSAGFASHDSIVWLMTTSVALSGGTKLAKAGAYPQAFEWLDQLLTELASESSHHSISQNQQVREQASFWFGVTDELSLQEPYRRLVASRSCNEVKTLNHQIADRIARGLEALNVGQGVAAGVTGQMRSILIQYKSNLPRVTPAIQCHNF